MGLLNFLSKRKLASFVALGVILPSAVVTTTKVIQYNQYQKEKEERLEAFEKEKEYNALKGNYQKYELPSRKQQFAKLEQLEKERNQEEMFDLVVIGGGATGTGVALDAQTRGLKVALFEQNDFSSGTSSRSTKLIHGGVRYLEQAIMNLDSSALKLVQEALLERTNLLHNAPHLSRPLPILIPIYSVIDLPKFWIGCKLYDSFYPFKDIPKSHYQNKEQTLIDFPYLKDGNLGSIVYYDGQHNDSRMNVSIALTAAQKGSIVLNHTEVVGFIKKENNDIHSPITGVIVKDKFTGKVYNVATTAVVNATGPFSDKIRQLDNPHVKPIISGSSGVHIVLPQNLCPPDKGFLNPKTKDGRVLFILPWEGKTIAGTTDEPSKIITDPKPTEKDIEFILETIAEFTKDGVVIGKDQVLSAWSGIRPLVQQSGVDSTSKISRSHSIRESPSGLISIVGGKWTTYRSMAQDTVDTVVSKFSMFTPKECVTRSLKLYGADQYFPNIYIYLMNKFNYPKDIAIHLTNSFGDQSFQIALKDNQTRIVKDYPYTVGEILFTVEKEYACTIEDVIARRTRLAFLDYNKAKEAIPTIADIMAKSLNWNDQEKEKQIKNAFEFLETMH
ncbi:hypothetical protein CYY_004090 [Polysphondylium violaceum]|uniref:Glycerol-3-phosphate dehydrogenase n=1 Tax=Polysphondylium violaceum TaxID=133409 RepID=A0A8J4PTS8_9MYCE|nr:hypothetical protein CYY_004090 [Polysphondylium violaceum]